MIISMSLSICCMQTEKLVFNLNVRPFCQLELCDWETDSRVEAAGISSGCSRRGMSLHSAVGHCITFIITTNLEKWQNTVTLKWISGSMEVLKGRLEITYFCVQYIIFSFKEIVDQIWWIFCLPMLSLSTNLYEVLFCS